MANAAELWQAGQQKNTLGMHHTTPLVTWLRMQGAGLPASSTLLAPSGRSLPSLPPCHHATNVHVRACVTCEARRGEPPPSIHAPVRSVRA